MTKLFIPFLFLIATSCQPTTELTKNPENAYSIIPIPAKMQQKTGQFYLDESTTVAIHSDDKKLRDAVTLWLNGLRSQLELELPIQQEATNKALVFELTDTLASQEGYHLDISPDQIRLRAKQPAGIFYGMQSLQQLIDINGHQAGQAFLPAASISDAPRFPYRGAHLDVARHFFSVEEVKQFIDRMSYFKLNRFHWHLTEDQGWRIEIKKYPKLAEVGGYRSGTLAGHYSDQPHQFDNQRYGGFYTQEEIKEVVEYAAQRFITIIPEIEMPGHSQAALAAYPELACAGDSFEVWQKWGVSENVFCPTEQTFEFLENVLEEVMALFPSEYIHIGGDECPKTRWEESSYCQALMDREGLKNEKELQSYFIQRIEKYINSKGKKIIGWDEILEGGLAPNATVMSWRGMTGGIEAAESGHDVIMTPTSHCYFDYYQSTHPEEPLAIGGLTPLQKVYNFEPVPEELNPDAAKHILGAQGNHWTEYIPNMSKLEYMSYPRLWALAEVVWSPEGSRDFEDFVKRLSPHLKRMRAQGINAANHLYELKPNIKAEGGEVQIELRTLAPDGAIRFTTDGASPSPEAQRYEGTIVVEQSGIIKAQAFLEEGPAGRLWQTEVNLHKAVGKSIKLSALPHPRYSGNGPASMINGIQGSDERYGDDEWLGFEGEDFEALIDLGYLTKLDSVQMRFYRGEGQWIYLPASLSVFCSADGQNFQRCGRALSIDGISKVVPASIPLNAKGTHRYLKIKVRNYGKIPAGKQGAGHRAWLFVDEISIY